MSNQSNTSDLIELRDVSMVYNTPTKEVEALKNISFSVKNNEFISLVGNSGCGKSTILSIISGLLKPTGGKVYYNNKEISDTNSEVGYMLQHDHLFPWCNVMENVCIGLKIRKCDTEQNRKNVMQLLDSYGLSDFSKSYPRELSGGMRQRGAVSGKRRGKLPVGAKYSG